MKKIAFAILLLAIVCLPFIFANKGSHMLAETGYTVKISENTEIYDTQTKCNEESCDVKSVEAKKVS